MEAFNFGACMYVKKKKIHLFLLEISQFCATFENGKFWCLWGEGFFNYILQLTVSLLWIESELAVMQTGRVC